MGMGPIWLHIQPPTYLNLNAVHNRHRLKYVEISSLTRPMYRFHTILLTHLNNWSNPLNITSLLHLEYDVRQLRSEQGIGTAELTELEKLKIQPVKFGIIHDQSGKSTELD